MTLLQLLYACVGAFLMGFGTSIAFKLIELANRDRWF